MNFDVTLDFVARLEKTKTPEEVSRALLAVTEPFGLKTLIVGLAPIPGIPAAEQTDKLLLCRLPEEWLERYIAQDYPDYDPVVACLRRTPVPITWRDAARLAPSSVIGRQIFAEAGAFNLKDGFAFPLVTLEGKLLMVSFGAEEVLDLPPQEFGIVSLASTYAVFRAMQLAAENPASSRQRMLTPREMECLKWAASGKSEWEISQILGISEHTAEKHLLNAKSKLGAINRVHAVAEAIRGGLIT